MNIKSNEKKENSVVELVIEVGAAEFDAAIDKVYNKQKKNIMIPGFRKGKAPRKMVEKMYGAEVFYEDAMSEAYPAAYDAALEEAGIEPVAYPTLEVLDVGKDGFSFKASITVSPEATVKKYKGLVVAKPTVRITAADVKAELKPYIDRASRLISVDRKAKKGDTVVIDFEGFKDGTPFDGGKGENYSLELGSGSFVPGFEEQIVGMKAGEERELNITFPEDYDRDLAGAAVVFKVKVNEVKERQEPTLDDEFAKDVSEFDTLEEFKKDLSDKLRVRRQEQAEQDYEDAIMDALVENLVCDVPEAMVEYRAGKLLDEYIQQLGGRGISPETYQKITGSSMDEARAQFKPAADRAIRRTLALEAVIAAENIEVSDAEVDAEYADMSKKYNISEDRIRAMADAKAVRNDLARQKALNLVKAAAKKPAAKKKAAEPEDETKEEKKAE